MYVSFHLLCTTGLTQEKPRGSVRSAMLNSIDFTTSGTTIWKVCPAVRGLEFRYKQSARYCRQHLNSILHSRRIEGLKANGKYLLFLRGQHYNSKTYHETFNWGQYIPSPNKILDLSLNSLFRVRWVHAYWSKSEGIRANLKFFFSWKKCRICAYGLCRAGHSPNIAKACDL